MGKVKILKRSIPGHKLGRIRAPRHEKKEPKEKHVGRITLPVDALHSIKNLGLPVAPKEKKKATRIALKEPKEKRQRWKKPKEIPYDGTAENRASKHWSPTKYRNRFGCFSDQAFLAQYFSEHTPDAAGFVDRNMRKKACLEESLRSMRKHFEKSIKAFAPKMVPMVTSAATLAELQAHPPFRRLVAAICEVPFEEVCAGTQAYIVCYARRGYQKDGNLQREVLSMIRAHQASTAPTAPAETATDLAA